jgi:hypothetical protein
VEERSRGRDEREVDKKSDSEKAYTISMTFGRGERRE